MRKFWSNLAVQLGKRDGLVSVIGLLVTGILGFGITKLVGGASIVESFEEIGAGQWLRYATGATEILFDQSLSPAQQRNLERHIGLPVNDRTLLILRVDRRMSWLEIAEILGEDPDPAALKRRSVALRKRFERLKESLGQQLRAQR